MHRSVSTWPVGNAVVAQAEWRRNQNERVARLFLFEHPLGAREADNADAPMAPPLIAKTKAEEINEIFAEMQMKIDEARREAQEKIQKTVREQEIEDKDKQRPRLQTQPPKAPLPKTMPEQKGKAQLVE